VKPTRTAWLAKTWDRVPTRWFTGILTGAFLVVTAAFGGLADAASAPVERLDPGETHTNDQFALTVERAVLIDELPEAGVTVEDGERVLALVISVENVWDRALPSEGSAGVAAAVRIGQLDDLEPASIARLDDATTAPYLQPHVPAELVMAWPVVAGALTEGDELDVTLRDLTLRTGQFVVAGDYWDTPEIAATLTLPVEDVGAGADDSTSDGADG
jgi:hypothetical protein